MQKIQEINGLDTDSYAIMQNRLELLDFKLKQGYHTQEEEHRLVVYNLLSALSGLKGCMYPVELEMFTEAEKAYNEKTEWGYEYVPMPPPHEYGRISQEESVEGDLLEDNGDA
jgi:hypothetical protein